MPNGRKIGYARVDTEQELDQLASWAKQLQRIGMHRLFSDVGPLTAERTGLRQAIDTMRINDVLVFPKACLRDLDIGDIPALFAGIPEGGRLYFFEDTDGNPALSVGRLATIRLSGTA